MKTIITYGFIQLMRNPHYSLYEILNLVCYIFAWVKAQVISQEVEEIDKKLQKLKLCYEPALDENNLYALEKRQLFDVELDNIVKQIVKVIVDENLLDERLVSVFTFEEG